MVKFSKLRNVNRQVFIDIALVLRSIYLARCEVGKGH